MANALTSTTGAVAANVATFLVPGKKDGVFLMVKYDKGNGTSVSLQPTLIAPNLSKTDEYQPVYLDTDGITVQPQSFKLATSGNYRIPITIGGGEKKMKLTPTFTGGTTQAVVADIVVE